MRSSLNWRNHGGLLTAHNGSSDCAGGGRFHNGQALTAADVKFTLDRVIVEGALNGYASPRRGLLKPISEVVVEDDVTLRILTRYPFQPYPFNRGIARQLLETAAYPEDRRVVICSHPDNLIFAQSIALFLTQVGLQTCMKVTSTMHPQTTGSNAPWDLFVGSWGNSTLDPVDFGQWCC